MVQIGFKCNKGILRENNEDACFVIPAHDVYIVADGVGGNNSGEVASRTAVSEIAKYVNDRNILECESAEDVFEFLETAIQEANRRIFEMSQNNFENRGMATTVVVSHINGCKAYFANIGDSRAYLLRKGRLTKLTVDHTYVSELISKGMITEDEAEHHTEKNVITKALGAEPVVNPDFYEIFVSKNDVIMLCTDGLYGELNSDEITEILDSAGSMNDISSRLVERANEAGGRDNITVVCIKI